jgi:hypothetical protein
MKIIQVGKMKYLKPEITNSMETKLIEQLTCSQCSDVQEAFSDIVYSQGNKVCLKCKDENKESDKKAFDRDIKFR